MELLFFFFFDNIMAYSIIFLSIIPKEYFLFFIILLIVVILKSISFDNNDALNLLYCSFLSLNIENILKYIPSERARPSKLEELIKIFERFTKLIGVN